MRFGIVGAGAIGCLFGARLSLGGHDVILLHRSTSVVRSIRKNGVNLREVDGTFTRVRVPVQKGPARLPSVDVLIVSVKAYDTREVAATYRRMIPNQAKVLSLQNGVGNIETLHSLLNNEVLAASTTEGAFLLGPGRVVHTGRGLTVVGDPRRADSETCSHLKNAFENSGFRSETSSNIHGVLWTKAIVNAAINPLSSLTRLPNGTLLGNLAIREIAHRTIDEGILVSRAERIRLVGDPKRLWKRILMSTRANKSSMLQDVEREKMTEIRQLNGAIVSYGKKTRVKTPVNEILTKLVLGLEESFKKTASRA